MKHFRLDKLQEIAEKCIGVPGVFVECGCFKGESAKRLAGKELWIYDTFEGMPKPCHLDVKKGRTKPFWMHNWCKGEYSEIQNLLPEAKLVKGLIEDTVPGTMPEKISLLHLDMDFYSPTKHALKHLFPLVSEGGYLVVDDYGSWKGCRKAVDEYFKNKPLEKTDYTQAYIQVTRP